MGPENSVEESESSMPRAPNKLKSCSQSFKTCVLDGINRLGILVDKFIKSRRCYPKDSNDAKRMNYWKNIYKDFKSSKTQTLLKEVQDTYGPDKRPISEVVNEIFDKLDSVRNGMQTYEISNSVKVFGKYSELFIDSINLLPMEIKRGLESLYASQKGYVDPKILAQASCFVNNLEKLMVAINNEDKQAANNLQAALLLQSMVNVVTLPELESNNFGKGMIGNYIIGHLLPKLKAAIDLHNQPKDPCLFAVHEFLHRGVDPVLSGNLKGTIHSSVWPSVLAHVGQLAITAQSRDDRVYGVLLLYVLSKTETFGANQDTDPQKLADTVVNSVRGIINILQTGDGFKALAQECFGHQWFKDNFFSLEP